MVTHLRVFPLLCFALLGATHADDAQHARLLAFAFDGLEAGINKRSARGDAEKKLLERFGRPDRSESTTQWEGDGLFQTKYWQYEGLEIRISQPVAALETWFLKIILKSSAYNPKFGLSIGAKKSKFLQELGRSGLRVKPTSNSLVYTISDSWSKGGVAFTSHAGVEIFFDQEDHAEKIVWDYYAD